MENRNEIGKVFKEKLSHLDKSPSDALWTSIKKDLDKKKKRRFLFWIFPSLLLLGVATTLIISLSDSDSKTNTNLDKKSSTTLKNNSSDEVSNATTSSKNESTSTNQISTNSNLESDSKSNSKSNSEAISSETNKNSSISDAKSKSNSNSKAAQSEINKISTTKKSTSKKAVNKSKKLISSSEDYEDYEVTQKYKGVVKKNKNILATKKNKMAKTTSYNKKSKLVKNNNKNSNQTTSTLLIENSKSIAAKEKQTEAINSSTQIVESKTDTSKINITDKKIITLKKKKEIKENDSLPKIDSVKTEKYDIYLTPYYGFNYFGKIGNGNSLSSQNNYSKSKGKINADFGIYARWMFNNKTGFRIGLGKTTVSNTLTITNTNANNDFLDISSVDIALPLTENTINAQFANDTEVVLTQESTYYEIPLEGYYVFSNKKIGMATAFGLSYYYLKENSLTLQSNTVSEFEIGRSRKISPVGLSGNLNLIFFYKINKTFSFDLSPSFKYQFFGYKDVNGFNPYLLSLRAGISYRL